MPKSRTRKKQFTQRAPVMEKVVTKIKIAGREQELVTTRPTGKTTQINHRHQLWKKK